MGAGADVPVKVVDRVTLHRSDADAWVARMRRDYLPLAEARGFTLHAVWRTRAPAPHAVDVVLEWALPDVRAWWRARAGAGEPAVVAWWAATDDVALGRSRSVMGPQP